jgi:hypothetical protein
MKELRFKIVLRLLNDSKKKLSDVRSSAGPVTSESLDKLQSFLKDYENEIASASPQKSVIKRFKIFIALGLLMAFDRLLQELVPEAIKVINHFLMK